MAERLYKYPRTPHVEGSRFQPGDDDLDCAPFADLHGKHIVVEEKLDGANAGVSFSPSGKLLLQSRGHFLDGGARERQFALFKTWATTHQLAFARVFFKRSPIRAAIGWTARSFRTNFARAATFSGAGDELSPCAPTT